MASNIQAILISLVRLGIGHDGNVNSGSVDWVRLKALVDKQGLSAVILDALNASGNDLTGAMPVQMKLEWIGEVLQNYEQRYVDYQKRIGELAGFYHQHGFKLMVLKGYGLSLNWPNPKHRPCGDIDIYAFGDYKAADEALHKECGIKIEKGHHHHTVFE